MEGDGPIWLIQGQSLSWSRSSPASQAGRELTECARTTSPGPAQGSLGLCLSSPLPEGS